MEIYKLEDNVPERRRRECGARVGAGNGVDGERPTSVALTITDLKQGVKNPNRVNVYVNDKYAFSLDVAQVVDLAVKIGKAVTESELEELRRASEFGKAYQRALEWVLVRPRSVRELRDYLGRRGRLDGAKERKREWEREREIADLVAKGEDIDAERLRKRMERARERAMSREGYDFDDLIVERLVQRGYVDDRKFAEYYVENRFVKKGVSQKRLKMELVKKGVSKEIIDDVLGGRDDAEEIDKIIVKKRAKYDDEKLVNYLCRQGFEFQLAQSRVREYGRD